MRIHFIGIGGIGISALAQYFLAKGYNVQGSDLSNSEVTRFLKYKGAKIFSRQIKENISSNIDTVVYSPAVPPNNGELRRAKELGIKTISYPQALGELTKKYFTIAVSGTHGKSTVTSMISLIMIKAGLDPTVVVGTKLKEFVSTENKKYFPEGTNFRMGDSKYLVIEADEYASSFLNYWPNIIVLNNIEPDHLDYYKTFSRLLSSFKKFIFHLSPEGILVENGQDINIQKIIKNKNKIPRFLVYNFQLLRFRYEDKLRKTLIIPGSYNRINALAALQVAELFKIPPEVSLSALSHYRGAWRRQEIYYKTFQKGKYMLISDYAHHPTEVRVTLEGIRDKFPLKNIWVVFQPHQYQRTFYLFNDFVRVFKKLNRDKTADRIIITDIYSVAGREKPEIKAKVSSQKLVRAINSSKILFVPYKKIISYLKENFSGQILVIMGAGNIYQLEQKL